MSHKPESTDTQTTSLGEPNWNHFSGLNLEVEKPSGWRVLVRGAPDVLCVAVLGAGFFYAYSRCIELDAAWAAAGAIAALGMLLGAVLKVKNKCPP